MERSRSVRSGAWCDGRGPGLGSDGPVALGRDRGRPPVLPERLTPEAVRGLVSTLSDQQVRALLLERLDALAETGEEAEGPDLVAVFASVGEGALDTVATAVERVPLVPHEVGSALARFHAPRGWDGLLTLIGGLLLALVIGLGAEQACNWLARGWRRRILTEEPETLGAMLGLLLRRVALDAVGLVVFYLVTMQAIGLVLSETAAACRGWLQKLFRCADRFGLCQLGGDAAPNDPHGDTVPDGAGSAGPAPRTYR